MAVDLEINRLGVQGDGIAVLPAGDVYVPFCLPGEQVAIDPERPAAKPKILHPSEHRIKPMCRHFTTCGGCATQHASDAFLAVWKRQQIEILLSLSNMIAPIRALQTAPPHSRRRAVFSLRRGKKAMQLGFHARGSDQIIDITQCALLVPQLEASFDALRALVKPLMSRTSRVQINATAAKNGLDLDLRLQAMPDAKQIEQLSSQMVASAITRLSVNGEVLACDTPPMHDFDGIAVSPPPAAFLQATEHSQAILIAAVKEATQGRKNVVDLFAGCGTFALPLSKNHDVTAIDIGAEMAEALNLAWRNASGLKRITSLSRDLFRRPLSKDELKSFEAAVLDPPRAGAQAQCRELAASTITRIAYVSCNPATFCRDARILCDAGFAIDWLDIIDQFRWSAHTELVACFSR